MATILGLDGKQINASEMELWHGQKGENLIEVTEEQMTTILAMWGILHDHIKEDPLFKDGMPDMNFSVEKYIRVTGDEKTH